LLVQLFVDTPQKINKEQHDLLVRLAGLRNEQVGAPDHSLFGKIKGAFK